MISNFSEVEKSLKRCLKEKVSITAATVVGFLIAGTAAFGAATNVSFTTTTSGQVTIKVDSDPATNVSEATNFISVAQYEELVESGDLSGLLTIKTNENGETVFAGVSDNLGTVTAAATVNGAITLLKTDADHSSIASSLDIEAVGVSGYIATAMEAAGEGHTVTNDGAITVGNYAVGMKANAGATAVNNAGKTITVDGTNAVGMSDDIAADKTTTLINKGTIDVTDGVGIKVEGAGKVNVEAGTIKVASGKTGIDIGTGSATGTTTVTGGNIEVAGTGTGIYENGYTGKLIVDGTTFTLEDGTGIYATGNAELKDITITQTSDGTGINYRGTTEKLILDRTTVNVADGTGIDISGNAELKDIAIILTDATGGTGISYSGGTGEATASISTSDLDLSTNGETGILAILSKHADSKLDIETGSLTTGTGKTGIEISGNSISDPGASKQTAAEIKTTLGATAGTGVAVHGAAYNDITVNLQDLTTIAKNTEEKIVVSGTGVNIASGEAEGTTAVNINQSNLQVAAGGKLVNVADNTDGVVNINVNQNVELAGTGNIVYAGAVTGNLNVNLNVKEDTGLNVAVGTTALDLSGLSGGKVTLVKNTGTVTIAGTGTLVKGNNNSIIHLTNQGLITLNTVDTAAVDNSSHISSGQKVRLDNYGTIDLAISSTDFLEKAQKGSLEELSMEDVRTTLAALGIVATGSSEAFTSVGYIQFSDGEYFTTAQALEGMHSIEDLAAVLNQPKSEERAFKVNSKGATLTAYNENDKLTNVQFNLDGTLTAYGANPITIDNSSSHNIINITKNGKVEVEDAATLNYSGNIAARDEGSSASAAIVVEDTGTLGLSHGAMTMLKPETQTYGVPANRVGIQLTGAGKVNFDNYIVNADIAGTLNNNALQGTLNAEGDSKINGTVTDIANIKVTKEGMLTFGADSIIEISGSALGKTEINLADGNMGVEIGENGNVLQNSNKDHVEFKGLTDTSSSNDAAQGKVVLLTNTLTENTTFNLGDHDLKDGNVVANSDIYYNITKGADGMWSAKFNENGLLDKSGLKYAELNNIYVATQPIHDLLSKDFNTRIAQLDDLYSNNIYSETVKMSLDTLKMSEDAVLSLNVRPKQGEFTAQGKFLFNNTDYDREGTLRDYKVETKNTGLLGAMEYGLTDTSSVGFAFSGTKQDLDMKNGASADGDAFYFGLYRNDKFNNIDLTTGLGYMVDRVDAENFIGKDKFDSTALSGYVQGKYNYALGESLTLSPKARLTVTRFQQDSINNGRMKQEEVKDTMADVELGVEIKKGIVLETGKMHLLAGASFTTNVAGKDDDYYKVNFISSQGNDGSTAKVKGANLEKNSLTLNIGADVELTNGVFYNGGLSYEFDDEDRDSIGVTLGAGYKF
ncbi:autotransporter domain-containing protein [Fusobacterium varium]|uniref:autotransporter domain-containing protein n=1 Tax=Fusobacterium TaxID=848 RepID=UPI0030CC2CE1